MGDRSDIKSTEQGPERSRRHILTQLFLSTLYLSAFTFGGGYVIITLLKQKFVDELHWIDDEEMLDLVAIAQSSPGAIAVNGAIVVGYKLAGLTGVFVSVLGAVIPPFLILTVISYFYVAVKDNYIVKAMLKGMTSGISAVIISTTWDMAAGIVKSRDAFLIAIMLITFIFNYYLNVNVVYIILGTACAGVAYTLVRIKHGGETTNAEKKE